MNGEMAIYKSKTQNFDQTTYDFLEILANDYRKKSKLADLR